jgi:VWFA-related protein
MPKRTRAERAVLILFFWSTSSVASDVRMKALHSPAVGVPPAATAPNIRADASLVLIPVHVTTADGMPVTNLTKDRFQLFEDHRQQQITYFAKEDAPISIGILLDVSGSMRNKMQRSSEAAAAFFKTANPEDEFFLIEFSDRAKLRVPFTNNPAEVYRRVTRANAFGRTALLDAIHLASIEMKNARNSRKAVLIISDGADNRSRYTPRQAMTDVLESGMQMYAIGIFDEDDIRQKRSPEEEKGPDLLEELAEETGGQHHRVDNLDQLASVATLISTQMHNQYLLGYSPVNAERDGKYHRVNVKINSVDAARMRTYSRRGYYAPVQ